MRNPFAASFFAGYTALCELSLSQRGLSFDFDFCIQVLIMVKTLTQSGHPSAIPLPVDGKQPGTALVT